MDNNKLFETLRELLRDTLQARFEGGAYAKLARSRGYADGYMRALLDANLIDKRRLLELVGDVRGRYLETTPSKVKVA